METLKRTIPSTLFYIGLAILVAFAPSAFANSLPGFITSNLSVGSAGEEVRLLQEWLSTDKTLYPEQLINGEYGPATARAVKRYQERKGMVLQVSDDGSASGVVGPMTRANLNADFSTTKGGIAAVESPYGAALVYDGKKFTPLSETRYLANKVVLSRTNLWIYPSALSDRETPILTDAKGYTVGIQESGKLYGTGPKGKAVTKFAHVAPEAWQHISILFTEDDAVFIFNNEVVETIPLVAPQKPFFSGFFEELAGSFKTFSFAPFKALEFKPFSFPAVTKTNSETGIFGNLFSFVTGLFGGTEVEKPAPVTEDLESVAETPVVEEKEVVAVVPIESKPKPKPEKKPIIPSLFAPATTTVVTPIATSSVPFPGMASSTATSSSPTSTTTPAVASSTAPTSTTPIVSLGGGGGGGGAPSNNAPVITLSGSAAVSVPTGTVYNDPGVTATDSEDGNITANVVIAGSAVNHLIPGDYTITYDVSDSAGLAATRVTRTVTVTPPAPIPEAQQVPQYPIPAAGQQVSYSLDSGAGADPVFSHVDINPLHVYVGMTQTMTVTASSPGGVASVQAVTQLDTTTLTLNLEKISESGDTATFSVSWVVYDTHVRTYRTTFTATANSGATNSTTMAWSDPCSGLTQGSNSSLSADCTVSVVDGLDGATLTIPNGITLTINSGGTWAWNPGTSIIINGVLSKGTGGQIRKGYLFYSGSNNSNADTSTKFFFTTDTQTNYVRVNTYAQSYYQSYYEGFYCLAPETSITLANGNKKPIKDIRVGDVVLGQGTDGITRPNIVTKLFRHDEVENGPHDYETLTINGRLKITAEHPVFTARGFIPAGDIVVGDTLVQVLGIEKVLSVEKGPDVPEVYNLETFPDHTYFADNVLVHNKFHHDFFLPP